MVIFHNIFDAIFHVNLDTVFHVIFTIIFGTIFNICLYISTVRNVKFAETEVTREYL